MDDWYVSVSLVEPLTSTYTGSVHEGELITPFAQDQAGVWRTRTDKPPGEPRVQELLERTTRKAQERRDALAQKLARGVLDDRSYGVAMRTIDADVSELDSKLSQLPTPRQGFRKPFGTDMTLEDRREYLKSVTRSITVSKGRVVEDRVVVTSA